MSISQRTYKYKGKVLVHVFKNSIRATGARFLTPNEYTLQLGLLEHPKGTILKTHGHNPKIKYKVNTTQEFIYVENGKIRVSYYSDEWKKVASFVLEKGDFMLHVSGGHGFEILKKCRLIELKQGPFPGDKLAKTYPNEKK